MQDEVWYFAYGSNLYIPQMLARVGEWKTSKRALLKGWKLLFNHYSQRWGGGTANIIETKNPNDIVYGVIYLITCQKLCVLSAYEGEQPKDVIVQSEGEEIKAKAYFFKEDKQPLKIPPAYIHAIIEGLRQHGYDEDVIKQIYTQAEPYIKDISTETPQSK